jgi:hypothetical protein
MAWRTGRRIRNQAPFLLVLLILAIAVAYLTIWPGHWRRGTGILAGDLVLAGLLRLLLPGHYAGLLAVRGRWRDALCFFALGAVILVVEIRLH